MATGLPDKTSRSSRKRTPSHRSRFHGENRLLALISSTLENLETHRLQSNAVLIVRVAYTMRSTGPAEVEALVLSCSLSQRSNVSRCRHFHSAFSCSARSRSASCRCSSCCCDAEPSVIERARSAADKSGRMMIMIDESHSNLFTVLQVNWIIRESSESLSEDVPLEAADASKIDSRSITSHKL